MNDCFKQILDKYARAPDIIVNSAGITKDGFLLRMKEEDFEKVRSSMKENTRIKDKYSQDPQPNLTIV